MLMSEERAGYDLSPLGIAAVDYARRGYWVFPVEPRGKKPLGRLVPHGLNQASNDPEVVAAWWRAAPNANIGISCGPSKLVVIDVDPRHGGDESIRDLMAKYPELDDTLTGETGGGGWHLCFLAPAVPIANSTGTLAPGLDVRGVGGYIVAPPSIHPDGGVYEWMAGYGIEDKQPARLPLPLIELLSTSPDGADAPVDVAAVLGGVGEGERDWQLFRLAAKLRYADLPIDWAYRLVGEAAAACVPAFPADEARKKVDSAYRYAAGKVGIAVEPERDPETGEVIPTFSRTLLDSFIRDGVPEPDWLIEGALVRGRIHLLYGEPESGKTIISLAWMANVISQGLPVVYVDEETGTVEIAKLLSAMGVENVDHLLHYFPFPGVEMSDVAELVAYCDALKPALVVFDSLTDMLSAAGLDENSGIEVTDWFRAVAQHLARSPYLPVVSMVDHIPKDAASQKYSVASRAKKSKSDVLWYVEKEEDFDQTKTSLVTLHRHKNRPGCLPKTLVYVVGGENGRLVCRRFDALEEGNTASVLKPTQRQVLETLRANHDNEGLSIADIKLKTMKSQRGIVDALKDLMDMGLIEREGVGKGYVYFAPMQPHPTYANADLHTMQPMQPPKGLHSAQVPLQPSDENEICIGEDDLGEDERDRRSW